MERFALNIQYYQAFSRWCKYRSLALGCEKYVVPSTSFSQGGGAATHAISGAPNSLESNLADGHFKCINANGPPERATVGMGYRWLSQKAYSCLADGHLKYTYADSSPEQAIVGGGLQVAQPKAFKAIWPMAT
jgi:hypothetical protein